MKTLNVVLLMLAALLVLASCGVPRTGSVIQDLNAGQDENVKKPSTPGDTVVVAQPTPVVQAPVVAASPSPISLTYYSLSISDTPLHDGHVVTMKGSCGIYQSVTYCWDDGIKVITTHSGQNFNFYNFTFWGMTSAHNGIPWGACSGDCQIDFMDGAPTIMSSNLVHDMVSAETDSSHVFLNGTPKTVSCTLPDSNHLDCVDFVINLAQVAI